MSFNIDRFIHQGLPFGGARPSQFEVIINSPQASINDAKFTVHCEAASLPPSMVSSIDVFYFGRPIKVAGDRVYPDWDVQVILDEDFSTRAILERWSNLINNSVGNIRTSALPIEGYKMDAVVRQFGKQGNIIREYTLVNLWPSMVEPIQTDWNAVNRISKYGVRFCYDYWIPSIEGERDSFLSEIE